MRKASGADHEGMPGSLPGRLPGSLPGSLRERLALLECGVLPVLRTKARASLHASQGTLKRSVAGPGFALGLACGAALGCMLLLGLLLAHPEDARIRQDLARPDVMYWAAPLLSPDRQLPARGSAEMAAALGRAPAAPSAPGAGDWSTTTAASPAARAIDTPFRTEVETAPGPEPATHTASSRPPLPEGLSSLGGPTQGQPASPQAGRTVWWKLPPAAWSPFSERSSGN
jgi:hypothetical protein